MRGVNVGVLHNSLSEDRRHERDGVMRRAR